METCYIQTNKPSKANEIALKIEKVKDQITPTDNAKSGTIPSDVMATYSTANMYKSQNNYEKAVEHYLIAIEGYKNKFGKDDNYATLINNLADLYVSLGNYKIAEPLYKEAL
ncbi:MAG: hypothetical protein OHK0053_19270 [Microscillaceae bacterium]